MIQEAIIRGRNLSSSQATGKTRSSFSSTNTIPRLPHAIGSLPRFFWCSIKSFRSAAINTMIVGILVGELDNYIRNDLRSATQSETKRYTTYCIGLSMGSHVCGFIGKTHNRVGILSKLTLFVIR